MKLITAIVAFIFPSFIARWVLNICGHQVHSSARIGFSFVCCNKIIMGSGASIGHLNFIRIRSLQMGMASSIGSKNRMRGPFNLFMKDHSRVSTSNGLSRASFPITYGDASLALGTYSIITHKHSIDLTRSITLGDYSILAGADSQMWTHGYYHADAGLGRVRIDGEIHIGDNVYIGSRCIFNPGVKVGNAIHIGAGCCISKDISEKGMYVSQPLRFINNNIETVSQKLTPVTTEGLSDVVFTK